MKYLIYLGIIVAAILVGIGIASEIPSRQFTITPVEEPVKIEVELIGWREVTAYSSTVDQCDDTPFITAAQTRVRDGVIACPRYFPFGTKILIKDKIYTCEDRLHQDYVHRFDIWFSTRQAALEFGKQTLEIKKVTIY